MKRTTILPLMAALLCTLSAEAKKNVNNAPYPYGNPVIKHMYTADASPHVMPDGRVWMVTSVDLDAGGGYSTMHSYRMFSSADMLNWVDHGEALHINDVISPEPEGEDWALWAPDMIYKDGLYYLYFPVNVREKGMQKAKATWTGVAVSNDLAKPFKVIQERIPGTKGIDPAVFRDDDGKIYLYYGSQSVAELKDNMIEFASPIKTIDVDSKKILKDEAFQKMWTGKAKNKSYGGGIYMEGPWMHKHNGKYYFNYHTRYGSDIRGYEDDPTRRKSELGYSVGSSPWGPLEYGGTLNRELGVGVSFPDGSQVSWRYTQSNHGGVVEYHGKDYLFYHTSALSSWRQDAFKAEGTWTQRSVCVDEIVYDANDKPQPVKQTIVGVTPVVVDQPFEVKITKEVESTGGTQFDCQTVDFGSGYYYFDAIIRDHTQSGHLELRLGSPNGQLVGTCNVTPQGLAKRNGLIETSIRDAKGKQRLYLVWTGKKHLNTIHAPRIFAGAPLERK